MKVSALILGIALLPSIAAAGDLPTYDPPPAAPGVSPDWDWSGVYLGAHGGLGLGRAEDDTGLVLDEIDGAVAGGQVGLNLQWNKLVVGVEGDASWTDMREDETALAAGAEAHWLASARMRLGLGFDRLLFYGTGGGAAAEGEAFALGESDTQTFFGWVAGGGAEVAMTRNLSFGAEYLHYDFGDETFVLFGVPFGADFEADVFRGRVNLKFGGMTGG